MGRKHQPLQAHAPKSDQPARVLVSLSLWPLLCSLPRTGACFPQGLAQGGLRQALGYRYSRPAHTALAWHQLLRFQKPTPLPLTLLPWLLLPEKRHPVKISYAQYEKYLKADNMIRTTAVCQVTDEPEVVVERDVILDNPTLTLEVKGW